MSKLNVDQKTVKELFGNKKADFLIPDYQRPYAWEEKECQALWEDVMSFAFPDDNYELFDSNNDEYFLGPIVTFQNDDGKMEVIDGQQRLTTLMLLLRAFYEKFENMKDKNAVSTRESIEKCIWKTDEFGEPDKLALKIDSEVAADNVKEEFLSILKTGSAPKEMKSHYAMNYRFFEAQIQEFLSKFPGYFSYLPTRLLNNCILLPIEAESQDTALRIFSTLNDRGKPLSDADIFKAQFYKIYTDKNEKQQFIEDWKSLEERCERIFKPISGTPMDELFTRYMYYERAKQGITLTTTEALRKFYERDSYKILREDGVLANLIDLSKFWEDVQNLDESRFGDKILRRLFVLNYAPNGMWTYFTSVYYLHNRDKEGKLDEDEFYKFLSKTTAFVWTYAIMRPGVNALRTPMYPEMVRIVNDVPVEFEKYKFDMDVVRNQFENFSFLNGRPITKSLITWWAFQDDEQEVLSLDTVFEIEHIYAKNRQTNEKSLSDPKNIESIGNKVLLEKRINIRASDYKFSDKKKYYGGYTTDRNQVKEGTKVCELRKLSKSQSDFTEQDIENRKNAIINAFIDYVRNNGLAE